MLHHILPIEQIISRAGALRMSFRDLSKASGVEVGTIHRVRQRSGGRSQTLEALQKAVVAEERRLLGHLAALHGDLNASGYD